MVKFREHINAWAPDLRNYSGYMLSTFLLPATHVFKLLEAREIQLVLAVNLLSFRPSGAKFVERRLPSGQRRILCTEVCTHSSICLDHLTSMSAETNSSKQALRDAIIEELSKP